MELQLVKKYDARAWDGVVVPLGEGNLNSYQGPWEQELAAVRASGRFEGKTGEIFRFSVLSEGVLTQIFLLGLGKDWSLEQVLESCAKVYRQCQELDLRAVCTDLRGVCPQFTPALFQKAAEAAALTGYRFDKYKTTPTAPGIETAAFLCEMPERYEAALVEAEVSAEATCIARDLINEPPRCLPPPSWRRRRRSFLRRRP
ncbi:MAG: M17 family peptidase N-terminal domain-containing protein [Vescimonas sp.]